MKVLEKTDGKYYLNIIPRFYVSEEIKLKIRKGDEVQNFETDAALIDGLLSIDMQTFNPILDSKYTVIATDKDDNLFWTGQVLYTERDKWNYTLSNSTENKRKF